MEEAGWPIPPPSVEPPEGYSGKWQLRAPKSLHRRLAERREAVSLNTLAVTLLAEGPRQRPRVSRLTRRMPDQPSDNRVVSAQPPSLPDPVLVELSRAWIDATRFGAVIEAFGPLPSDGQVELVNRLIDARGQYLCHRMWECDKATPQGVRRKRLEDIGAAAHRLLRLLDRDEADPQPWNLHPAITLALPRLCDIAMEDRPNLIWDPPQGLSLLGAMLADLAAAGAQGTLSLRRLFRKRTAASDAKAIPRQVVSSIA
jgi:hypothetical protein